MLGYNNLNGDIPLELCNLINLEELDLRANQLTGQVPRELRVLPKLNCFQLGENSFSD